MTARVYPVWIRNTEGDQRKNRAPFTLLSDRTQGYQFLCKDIEVRFLRLFLLVIKNISNDIRDRMGGILMSCFPKAGQNF